MEKTTRIRINLSTREVEWEGSENFIGKYDTIINDFIEKISNSELPNKSLSNTNPTLKPSQTLSEHHSTETSFGEFYVKFPRNIKMIDKVLIAAYYIQQTSEDGLFTSKEISEVLSEQNVKVTNASAFVKALGGKVFSKGGKYRVSEKGIEVVTQLMSAENNQ